MSKYRLTEEDYLVIENLLDISRKIKIEYNRLKVIEKLKEKQKDNAILYDYHLKELKNLLAKENILYESLDKDINKLKSMSQVILEGLNYDVFDILNNIKENHYDAIIKGRVVDRLANLIDLYEALDLDFKYYEFINEFDKVNKSYGKYYISKEVEMDLIKTIIYFLDLYINDERYMEFKDKLCKIKRDFIFSFEILKDYLLNEKTIEITWRNKLIADLIKNGDKYLVEIKDSYAQDIMFEQIDSLLSVFIDNNNENKFLSLLSQIFIRAGVLFSKEDTYINFQCLLEGEISNLNLPSNVTDDLIEELKYFNNDKGLVRTLSFKP